MTHTFSVAFQLIPYHCSVVPSTLIVLLSVTAASVASVVQSSWAVQFMAAATADQAMATVVGTGWEGRECAAARLCEHCILQSVSVC